MKLMLLTIANHPGTQGGIQTFLRTIKKYFKDDAFFVTGSAPMHKDIIFNVNDLKNIRPFYKNSKISFILKVLSKISRELLKKDILNIFYRNKLKDFNGIVVLSSPKELKILNDKCKKILVQHNKLDILLKSKAYFDNDKKLLDKAKNELDVIVALSPADKKLIEEKINLKKGRVVCIRHSCELSLIEEKKEKNKNLIMIARISNAHKRFDLAIKSMKFLPEFTLNIYGDGPDRNKLEKLVEELGLKNVIFHGKTNKIQEKLDENGIFVMTSDYEGYPISTIEAMGRGLPIILRNTFEAAADIVQGNGTLLGREWNQEEFVNGIKNIYENYEVYSKVSIELGKRHNPEVIKKQWEELFEVLENESN